MNNNQLAFFALLKAGLWNQDVNLSQYKSIDFDYLFQLSEEHAVTGLITAGLDSVNDIKVPQDIILTFVGSVLQLEQRNKEMNEFIANAIEKMRKANIYGLLVKGSGLAQCYEKPLWRTCGDVDFFFSHSEYKKAVMFFNNYENAEVFQNARYTKSYGVTIDSWMVELHGTLRSGLSLRLDVEIDKVQREVFYGGDARSWINGRTQVFLPGVNSDLFLLFTHFVRHFYQNEFVLRQICDWCRFLWTYKGGIDVNKLQMRLKESGLMTEWKAFAALAVEWLGMPADVMPLYDSSKQWRKKAEKIINYVMKERSYSKLKSTIEISTIFPCNTIKFLPALLFNVNYLKIKERFSERD